MRHRKRTADRRKDRYIESEKEHTKTERAREVRDRASPDRSRETDGSSGIDLTQERGIKTERRRVGNGYSCRECVDETPRGQRVRGCVDETRVGSGWSQRVRDALLGRELAR